MSKNRFDEIGNLNSINGNWDQTLVYKLFSEEWRESILTKLTGVNGNPVSISPYSELITAEKTTLIELKSIYGFSELRDSKTEVGSGTVTNDFREYKCKVNGINSTARLESRDRGRYISGKSAEYGIGVRTNTDTITGDGEIIWGGLNDTNGMYFGKDSTGLFVGILDEEVETKIYQDDWNMDKLDGTGISGEVLDLTKANIYNIEFTWYGYGIITFKVQLKTVKGMKLVEVHNYIVDNKTSIQNPNLPITAQVKQSTGTEDIELYVGGRQFSVLGSYTPSFRTLSEYFLNKSIPTLSTNPTPILSFKHKKELCAVDGKLSGVNISTNNQIIFEVYLADEDALTGADFGTPTRNKTTETAFEVDSSATAFDYTKGNLLYRDMIDGGVGGRGVNNDDFRDLIVDIPDNKILVLTAFATESNSSIDGVLRIREEW